MQNNFWKYRPVFITGGTGFLGRWLTERLIGLGAEVTLLVRNFHPYLGIKGVSQIAIGDVRDQSLLERTIGERQCRTVFHLAAQAEVEVASANPISTWDTNVHGTWSLLEACRRCPRVEQIIVASTDKVYGEMNGRIERGDDSGFREGDPLNASHPYDVSKACADRIATSYAETWNLPVTVTRLGNIFGGKDRTWSRLVPGTIRRLLNGERPTLRGDGSALRDWLYVEDAVDGYLSLAEWSSESAIKETVFNFSLGIRLSVVEVIDCIATAMNLPVTRKYSYSKTQHEEIRAQSVDSSLARRVLHWEPKHTFAEGISKTVAWYKENL